MATTLAFALEVFSDHAKSGSSFVLLMLWIAHHNLSPRAARVAAGAAIVVTLSAVLQTFPSPISTLFNHAAVIAGAGFIMLRKESETIAGDLTSLGLSGDIYLPNEQNVGAPTISVDSDQPALQQFSAAEILASDLIDRMQQSKAFLPKQINRVRRFVEKRSDTRLSLEQLVYAGLLTEFQAIHMHWGREDQLRFDKYSLVEMIGRGGMSTVFRAMNMERGETVAIKLLTASERALCRAQRETEVAKQLAHKNIVIAYDSGRIRSRFYIELEYVSGSDLHQIVNRSGILDETHALNYALQIARGLQHAHSKGLLHRDVKPGNMLVTADGVVKITDLGLACGIAVNPQKGSIPSCTNRLVGTIEFMSPEQAMHEDEVDERTDIYSLGATLFFLLTGQSRVVGTNVGQQITNLISKRRFLSARKLGVREEVAALIDRLCHCDPDKRFSSMSEVIAAIEALSGPRDIDDGPISVLIVEDNKDDLYAARRMLGKMNRSLHIAEATTLAACRTRIDDSNDGPPIHLVLLDLNLPDSAGFETITHFRSFCPCIPLIVMTGIADPDYGAKCIDGGANDYLPKNNATPETLERSIFMTLARCRTQDEESSDVIILNEPSVGSSNKDVEPL
ncbi:protein kinase domain-containing protein [Planctomycetes bacterium CA13]|uniref:protein kinase domain-containing protein n=1 Tax=Novipirellula herctigrandis TaxID=2527986 RepID=UPI0011B4375A